MVEALVLCRFLHYSAAMLVFGASTFLAFVAPVPLAYEIGRPLRSVFKAAVTVMLATAAAWLMLTAGNVGDGWRDTINLQLIQTVLVGTSFGRTWQWYLVLSLLLTGAVILKRDDWRLITMVSGFSLTVLGIIGHAAAQQGALGWLSRGSNALHLLAAGFWLGSLIPLIPCLGKLADPRLGRQATTALRRYSGTGHVAVATVLATGLINTWVILDWPSSGIGLYAALLLAKIAIVAIMVSAAIFNRYVTVPRLRTDIEAIRALRSVTVAEVALGSAVTALVSMIGTLPPT